MGQATGGRAQTRSQMQLGKDWIRGLSVSRVHWQDLWVEAGDLHSSPRPVPEEVWPGVCLQPSANESEEGRSRIRG